MAWVVRLTLAAMVAVTGLARSDDSAWRTPPAEPPSLPKLPLPPPPGAETPGWTAGKREAGPIWSPSTGSRIQTPAIQEPAPAPRPMTTPPAPGPLPGPRSLLPMPPVPSTSPGPAPAPVGPNLLPYGNGNALEPVPCADPAAAGVPVRHRTFGSPSLTLSRDYHFLDLFGLDLFTEQDVVLSEGPAEDRSFFQAEYLLWWVKQGDVPTLATTGAGQSFGYLGQPGTTMLLGPGEFGSSSRNGFRIRGGTYFDACPANFGIDGSLFVLGKRSTSARLDSGAFPTIARPIFAPNFDQEFAELVAFPGLSTGSLQVEHESLLWGADVNLRCALFRTCGARAEWFAGYRHLNLREELTITEVITAGPNAPDPQGTRIVVRDSFKVRNQFHGGQIGYAAGRRRGRIDVDLRASVALGVTHQELEIAGSQQKTLPGQTQPAVFNGGLLAVGPNLGEFSKNRFSVVPEATINVGYMVTTNLKAYVGYNFLYWTNVIRPGEQIDRVVDLSFVPNAPPIAPSGENRPQPLFRQSDLWAHGLQFGLELRW